MTLAQLETDLRDLGQHVEDLITRHAPVIEDAAAKLARLEASPIVQALEGAVGITPELEASIASLISTFVKHAQAAVPVEAEPVTPAGPDAEPDPQPAAA